MVDPKPLYRGLPESARSLAGYLEQHGVDSHLEDHFEIGVRSRASGLSRQIVFVEDGQLVQAEALRDQWLAISSERAQRLSRRLGLLITFSLALPVSWLAVWSVVGEPIPVPHLERLFVAWLVTFVVLAQIDARRRSSERIEMPGSGAA